jgi:GTP pyrophosphokinase
MKLGSGKLELTDDLKVLFKKSKDNNKLIKYWKLTLGISNKPKPEMLGETTEKIDYKATHKLTEESFNQQYKLADCCHPIPGDDVLGFVEDNGSVSVHKRQCPVAMKIKSSYGTRILSAEWATQKALSFPIELELRGIDGVGIVSQITKIVSDELAVNMTKLLFETKDGIFKGLIELYVHDVEDVNNLCDKISRITNVQLVRRKEQMNG